MSFAFFVKERRGFRVWQALIWLMLCSVITLSTAVGDEGQKEEVRPVALPAGIPPLPGPDEVDSSYYISKNNVSLFHELLLAPVASWLKDGRLIVRATRNLGFSWQLNSNWETGTEANAANFALDDQRNLLVVPGFHTSVGYPFGSADEINREQDARKRAYMILWNAVYAEIPSRDLLYDVEFSFVSDRTLLRRAGGIFYRRGSFRPKNEEPLASEGTADEEEPAAEENGLVPFARAGDLLSEEVFKLYTPPVVFGFADITWRYRGTEEDRVWAYTPVIGRSRQISSSNRGDPILDSLIAMDDRFVWSVKVQEVNARVVEEKVLLVPFPSLRIVDAQMERFVYSSEEKADAAESSDQEKNEGEQFEDILAVRDLFERRDQELVFMVWNHETKRFPRAAAWVPAAAHFVPRKVWILEVSPRDPYYLAGRQILVVDQESMLPVYKVVYDRKGTYVKTVLGGWGLASSRDARIRFPFSAFVLAVGSERQPAATITTTQVRTFLGKESKKAAEVRALLDIENYQPEEEAEKEKEEKAG